MDLLEKWSKRPWPKNAVTAMEVQRVCVCKEAKASAVLTRMMLQGKLASKNCRITGSKRPLVRYYLSPSTTRSRKRRRATAPRRTNSRPAPVPAKPRTTRKGFDMREVDSAIEEALRLMDGTPASAPAKKPG